MNRAILALAAVGCGTPTPQLLIGYAEQPPQACPSPRCAEVPLPCDAVMSIRIVDVNDPSHAYLSQCTRVPTRTPNDACSLNGVELDSTPIPVQKVAVQVAVYPASALAVDDNNQPVCPETKFSADGFPMAQLPAPAFGRSTIYHPGDQTVNVKLGCNDLSSARSGGSCGGAAGSVTAMIDDFDTRLPVTGGAQGVANDLWVSVGEPHSLDGKTVLRPLDAIALRLEGGDPPEWTGPVAQKFNQYTCVEVVEDVARTTPALRCAAATSVPGVELKGIRIARKTLDTIVGSLVPPVMPDDGLTIGMVVDSLSQGVSNYIVTAPNSTVRYFAPGGLGGTTTSATGIFVSTDAPFGTVFSATGAATTVPAVGGRVAGKVTIVIVPFAGR
ncbi:MAG TPA: hypothetical protein VGD37_19755 [Kofleriaceae bacterium]|jgi:hypothetical protein